MVVHIRIAEAVPSRVGSLEQQLLIEQANHLFGEFRARLRQSQALLGYLEAEQKRKRRARLAASLRAHGYQELALKVVNKKDQREGRWWWLLGAGQ